MSAWHQKKVFHMAIFYRAVRNLVDFSLVTKLTKHVSKVRETVRKCEKIRQNDCETFFMTSNSQKMILRFLDSYFCTKFQISQPGWYPDQAIKKASSEIPPVRAQKLSQKLHFSKNGVVTTCRVSFARTKHNNATILRTQACSSMGVHFLGRSGMKQIKCFWLCRLQSRQLWYVLIRGEFLHWNSST